MLHAPFASGIRSTQRSVWVGLFVAAAAVAASPQRLIAQVATRAADAPSQRADTRIQSDSITVHRLRLPKGKPAALSAGGKTAAQARKFSGKSGAVAPQTAVETPLPTRTRTSKP